MGLVLPNDRDEVTWAAQPTPMVTATIQGAEERRFLAYVDGLPVEAVVPETPDEAAAVAEADEDIRQGRVRPWSPRRPGPADRRERGRDGNS